MDLVIASNNLHKIREIKEIIGAFFPNMHTLKEMGLDIDVEETGKTFYENAKLKAVEIARLTGMAALADDSGIVVDALGGTPGVYSARYAGEGHDDKANNRLLLENLSGVTERTARFVSAVVICFPDGTELSAEGSTEGYILDAECGENGFGYDPLFFSTEIGKGFGVAAPEEKHTVSHRGRALRRLRDLIVG